MELNIQSALDLVRKSRPVMCTQFNHNQNLPSRKRVNIMSTVVCEKCKTVITVNHNSPAGYGVDNTGKKFCYQCCADLDRSELESNDKWTGYLSKEASGWYVTNWTGLLKMKAITWTGRHNIARKVTFFRFVAPDGSIWTGRQMGEYNQIAHCKRTKLASINA
jgi:hypothetical protein